MTQGISNALCHRRDRTSEKGLRSWSCCKVDSHKIRHPQSTNSSAIEILSIEIPTPNSQTFTVSNWYFQPENIHYLQRTGISLSELQPDTKVRGVICADVNAHGTAWDQTASPNARAEYLVNSGMDVNSTKFNDPEQPTRQNPATGALSSPDATIVHAAFRDFYDWKPLDTLSSDHRQILIRIHLPTEKLRRGNGTSGIERKGI